VTLALVPFAVDLPSALSLAGDALRSRIVPGEDLRDMLPPLESAIRSARAFGGLLRSDGEDAGIVLWEPAGPFGVSLRLLHLSPGNSSVESYRALLDLTERAAGPIAFSTGLLAGLSADEESTVMRMRGFAPYGRSEMGFPPAASVPPVPVPTGAEVRAVRLSDEPELARLHERAYRDHLDRYFSIQDLDPVRDADRQVRDYFAGAEGELLIPGSTVTTVGGGIVAATLAVRRTAHALIIDVMADPTVQGNGFGRSSLSSALRALRGRGENAIVLNVTEGNDRAIRLYTRLGFVRTIGPSSEWYDARRISVEVPRPSSP